jgi:hypothetical protein
MRTIYRRFGVGVRYTHSLTWMNVMITLQEQKTELEIVRQR